MDILYSRGDSSVSEVLEALPDAPTYSTVRALLKILEDKGHIEHSEVGLRYVYRPTQTYGAVAKSTMEQVVDVFFGGSVEKAVATLLSMKDRPSYEELDRLEEMIQQARNEERGKEG
jgi:predicted transcriptional regulator